MWRCRIRGSSSSRSSQAWPARNLLATQAEANRLVNDYIATDRVCRYVDVATPMLGPDGQPRPELLARRPAHEPQRLRTVDVVLSPLLKPERKRRRPALAGLDVKTRHWHHKSTTVPPVANSTGQR